jgi:DNA invertase Pin-like site-specific DNA recombinase
MTGKSVGLYMRVSSDQQTIEMQRRDLTAAVQRRGWRVVAEYVDEGFSGSRGRDKRPGFDSLHKAIARHEFDIVAAWSVDRLGRSLQDLVGFLGEVHGVGCDLYLDRQGLDTGTPAGKALFQMLGVFSEFERSLIVERVKSGIARARVTGTRSGRPFGRPKVSSRIEQAIVTELGKGKGILKVARELGIGSSVVQRVKKSQNKSSSQ